MYWNTEVLFKIYIYLQAKKQIIYNSQIHLRLGIDELFYINLH